MTGDKEGSAAAVAPIDKLPRAHPANSQGRTRFDRGGEAFRRAMGDEMAEFVVRPSPQSIGTLRNFPIGRPRRGKQILERLFTFDEGRRWGKIRERNI
jgi:hypothetical protein